MKFSKLSKVYGLILIPAILAGAEDKKGDSKNIEVKDKEVGEGKECEQAAEKPAEQKKSDGEAVPEGVTSEGEAVSDSQPEADAVVFDSIC